MVVVTAAQVGANVLAVAILLFFFVFLYARITGKTLWEVWKQLSEFVGGDDE